MPDSKIFDAWALLSWLLDQQPAAAKVEALLQKADEGELEIIMSWINAGEVYYMAARKVDAAKAEDFGSGFRHYHSAWWYRVATISWKPPS